MGALVRDMVPSRRKYATMTWKQYAEVFSARLEPVTEKRLLYQQFRSRMQQTGKSFYLYVLDKYNLLKHSSVQKTILRILWIIRLDDWQFKNVCEFCLVQVQKKLTNFKKLVYVNFTLVETWLQSGEIDAAKAIGSEVCLFCYSTWTPALRWNQSTQ